MSLCPLMYNNKQGINSTNHLVSIMKIGNQLYSSLSQLTRQSFLMQTELPTLLNVLETDYELQYSESYTASRQKINISRIIHDRQLRNCVTTALTLVAVGFSERIA